VPFSRFQKKNDGFNKLALRQGWIALGNDYTAREGKSRLLGNYVSNLPVIEQSVTPTIESNSRIARKPVAIVRAIEAAAAIELARRRGLPVAPSLQSPPAPFARSAKLHPESVGYGCQRPSFQQLRCVKLKCGFVTKLVWIRGRERFTPR
jgi:hypothetical protein